MTSPTSIQPTQLPATVRGFLATHEARDVDAAAATFDLDAQVVDQDRTFRGQEEVRGFLGQAGAEFSCTTQLVAARRDDDVHWSATHRLEGDFPGGVADLDYRFTMAGDLIAELVIAPR